MIKAYESERLSQTMTDQHLARFADDSLRMPIFPCFSEAYGKPQESELLRELERRANIARHAMVNKTVQEDK